MKDQVVLVTSADQEIGVMDKRTAHQYPLQLHRAISIWLFRHSGPKTELLLQQRSQEKITGAGWWANSVCGNVWPGESYAECAQRRLLVELGIESVPLQECYTFTYQAYVNQTFGESEVDRVFTGSYTGEIHPNPQEVMAYRWVPWRAFRQAVLAKVADQSQPYPLPAQSLDLPISDLKTMAPALEIELAGQTMTIVPWTVMMILDAKVIPPETPAAA